MSWFQLALILHILGVLELIAAIVLQLAGAVMLRGAQTIGQIRVGAGMLRRLPPLFGTATLVIMLSGIYMMVRLHTYGWTTVAIVTMVLMAAIGSLLGKHHGQAIMAEVGKSKGAISPALRAVVTDRSVLVHHVSVLWVVAALVVVMIVKPPALIAVIILVAAWLVGVATVLAWRPVKAREPAVETGSV